jgi:hypothetical protein
MVGDVAAENKNKVAAARVMIAAMAGRQQRFELMMNVCIEGAFNFQACFICFLVPAVVFPTCALVASLCALIRDWGRKRLHEWPRNTLQSGYVRFLREGL